MIEVPARVKDALKEGDRAKNYRFNVLNDDGTIDFTIDNDTLIAESVKFDERMCSGDRLKFGLCEGTSLEFQYFDHPNINGRRLQALLDVQYIDENHEEAWHTIPMGFFTVEKCPRQVSTGIFKITAYNKLMSDYLDAKANSLIELIPPDSEDGKTSLYTILWELLDDYGIEEVPKHTVSEWGQETYKPGFTDTGATFKFNDSNVTLYCIGSPLSGTTGSGIRNIESMYNHEYRFPYQKTYLDIGDLTDFFRQLRYVVDTAMEFFNSNVANSETVLSNFINRGDMAYAASIVISVWKNNDFTQSETYVYTFPEFVPPNGQATYFTGVNYKPFSELPKRIYSPMWIYSSVCDIVGQDTAMTTRRTALPISTTWRDSPYCDSMMNLLGNNIYITLVDDIPEAENIRVNVNSLNEVTLRELQSAVFESVCQYGRLDRATDLFSGEELNKNVLYPAEDLYPDDALYPGGTRESTTKAMYNKLWTDSGGIQKFRYLIITYLGTDEQEHTLQRTVDEHGTMNYNMSDNWLFKNLPWTAEQVGAYADAMVAKMQNITWFPFEMWCAGLPYIETGDEIEISTSEGVYTSYILQRQLGGIQNLEDNYVNGTLDVF